CATRTDRGDRRAEHSSPMRTVGYQPRRLLLPAVPGEPEEPGADAFAGPVAPGASGLREPAIDGTAQPARVRGQPQAGETVVGVDGDRGNLPASQDERSGRSTQDLPVFAEGE